MSPKKNILIDDAKHSLVTPQDVAVIVAVKNEGDDIRACVNSLLEAAPEAELIFVDDRSEDDTNEILQEFSDRIEILRGEGRGPGAARNLAIRKTTKKWIGFTDGDCEVDRNWLKELCIGISESEVRYASIGGLQKVSPRAGKTEAQIGLFLELLGFVSDYLHSDDKDISEVEHNPTCTVLYARDAIESVGGFDEALWPTEDLDLDYRLEQEGRRALVTPKAFVYHRRPKTWRGFGKMMKRYGFAHAQFVKKHGISQKIHILPFVFPFLLGLFLALLVFRTYIALLFLAVVALPVLALFALRTRKACVSLLFTGILFYTVGSWLRGFFRGMMGRRRIFGFHA